MRGLIKNNTGSITVEMCFVMPVVIGIIMMLIFLILRGLNEGTALGTSQTMVYEYSGYEEVDFGETNNSKYLDGIMFDQVIGSFQLEENSISANIRSSEKGKIYSISAVGCTREHNLCTARLRRWQLYGNVLRE